VRQPPKSILPAVKPVEIRNRDSRGRESTKGLVNAIADLYWKHSAERRREREISNEPED
jgi:hypothetical protein